MNLKTLRLAADFAAHRQHLRYEQMSRAWSPWRYRLSPSRHPVVTVVTSFIGGALFARVPGNRVVGSAGTLIGLASFVLRSPFSSLLIASIATARTKKRPTDSAKAKATITTPGISRAVDDDLEHEGKILEAEAARASVSGDADTQPKQTAL